MFSCILHENPEFCQRERAFWAVSVHREAVTMKVLNSYILPKKLRQNENSLTIVHNYVILYQVVYHISYIIYHVKRERG